MYAVLARLDHQHRRGARPRHRAAQQIRVRDLGDARPRSACRGTPRAAAPRASRRRRSSRPSKSSVRTKLYVAQTPTRDQPDPDPLRDRAHASRSGSRADGCRTPPSRSGASACARARSRACRALARRAASFARAFDVHVVACRRRTSALPATGEVPGLGFGSHRAGTWTSRRALDDDAHHLPRHP